MNILVPIKHKPTVSNKNTPEIEKQQSNKNLLKTLKKFYIFYAFSRKFPRTLHIFSGNLYLLAF